MIVFVYFLFFFSKSIVEIPHMGYLVLLTYLKTAEAEAIHTEF